MLVSWPDIINPKLVIRGPDAGVDFLVDNVIMYELPENRNWKAEADANIEQYRKSNIMFK